VIVEDVPPALDAISNELNDKAHLSLAQQRLDRAHDSELAADLQPLANLERLVTAQMTGRDHLVVALELIAIVDPSHGAKTIRATGALRSEPAWALPLHSPPFGGCLLAEIV